MDQVRNYTLRTLTSLCADDTIGYAIELMFKSEMLVLPIVDEHNVFEGTLYIKNILKNVLPEEYGFVESHRLFHSVNLAAENIAEIKDQPVSVCMSSSVTVVRETDDMSDVTSLMLNNNEQYLFVVNSKQQLRGYISHADLLYYLLKLEKTS